MFCQSCGQKNIDEARFCNFCGAKIAAPGEPGGRTDVSPSRPSTSAGGAREPTSASFSDSLTMSLSGLGIRTKRSAFGVLAIVAAALMGLGAIVALFAAPDEPAEEPDRGHAAAGDGFLIGAPIPEGLEIPPFPEDEAAPSAPDAPSRPRREPPRTVTSNAIPVAPSRPKPAEPPANEPAPAPEPRAPREAPTEPAEEPASPAEPPPSAISSEELELYSGRVRFAVTRYFAGATQSCFDAATQRTPSISGTVVVSTKVGEDGRVEAATLARNSTGDQTLGECLVGQVRSFRLPPPPRGEIELKLPFSR